jgi:hypothetical protein
VALSIAGRTKTVTRRAAPTQYHGVLVFIVAEEGIYWRQKGRRTKYLLPYGAAFQYAVELHVAREREMRKQKAKVRRKRS